MGAARPVWGHGLRIFLSYRREDTLAYAGRIYDHLILRFGKDRVFMDIDTIRPGSDFAEVIADALDTCDVFLALIGRTWLTQTDSEGRRRLDDPDDFVRKELEAALHRNITIIPVLVQDAKMPTRGELPVPVAEVATRQAFEISDRRWGTDMTVLIDELDRRRGEKAPKPKPHESGDRTQGMSGRGWLGKLLRASQPAPSATARQPLTQRHHRIMVAVVSVLAFVSTVIVLLTQPTVPPGVDAGPALHALLKFPYGVALDAAGSIYIADSGNLRVRRVDRSTFTSTISTIAGTGEGGNSGDGGPAIKARTTCHGVAVTADGAILIAAIENNNVRKVDPAGTISTLAGNGTRGYSGDGGPATQAQLNGPWDVDVGPDGSIYIADTNNNRIRRVNPVGLISTVAGTGMPGSAGDGERATQAQLTAPRDVAVGPDGDLYIADGGNHRVRRVDTAGRISTVAGTGTPGFAGDGGSATRAQLNTPHGVDVDADGNIYIADLYNNRVRKVDRNGTITTVAGNGVHGYSGDGGRATDAQLAYPRALVVYTDGTIYIADINNNRIRKVEPNGTITTAVGGGA